MFTYGFLQWIMLFYIYCFVGWCIESSLVSIHEKKFVNRGFIRGPFLPLYGFGAITILVSTLPVRGNPILVFICGMIATTILEYFTAWLMETFLKMKYWDYSEFKFNYKGRISLMSSLFWGVLSLLLTYLLHGFVEGIVLKLTPTFMLILVIIISCFFVSDTIVAFRTAFDMNKLLEKITNIKQELEQLKVQLTSKFESNEKAVILTDRINELKEQLSNLIEKIGFLTKNLINAHPTASSKNFNEALKDVRAKINERKKKKE